MHALRYIFAAFALAVFFFAGTPNASAHEVYVLDGQTIAHDLATESPNPFGAYYTNQFQFFFWGFLFFVLVSTIFCTTLFHIFEERMYPLLSKIKRYAPLTARLTLGVCLIACGWFEGLFGPELPLTDFAGNFALPAKIALMGSGALITLGLYTRVAAAVAIFIFACSIARYGFYMLNYANYLGEMLIVLILGGGMFAVRKGEPKNGTLARLIARLEPFAFPIARIGFGISIAFAAIYAKFLHSNLALSTISEYHLTDYFHFEPLFIVLGACIIEVLMGLFFIFGVQIRWNAIFFLFWLGLSLWYFGESVWPHLVLLGLNITFILHGYDKYSLEKFVFRHRKTEPVL